MSRSNYDKPFYVDVGTSIAAVRCASNHEVLVRRDHVMCGQRVIKEVEELCDRLNKEAEEWRGKTANPPMVRGEKTFTLASLGSIPELGIEFHAYHTKDYYKFMCWWHNDQDPVGHVYELTVKEWGILAASDGVPKWRALAMSGGKTLFSLESSSKRLAIECALTAMRRYLIRGNRAAWRTYRKAEAAKQQADDNKPPRVAPLSPEEELANTIARQKEAE